MPDAYLSVRNFDRFQHYKDRCPPWIKLYNEILDDYEFGHLPDASKAHLIAIWLLASRYDNKIPADPEWIARRINATEPVNLAQFVSAGFLESYGADSIVLAPRKQSAMPEESRGEKRERKKRATSLPEDWSPTDEHRSYCATEGVDIEAEEGKFRLHALKKDSRYVNWNAAFSQWIRSDYVKRSPNGNGQHATTTMKSVVLDAEGRLREQ